MVLMLIPALFTAVHCRLSSMFFLAPCSSVWHRPLFQMTQIKLIGFIVTITFAVPPASAWNIPGHMLSGAIAYQVLQQERPQTIDKVKTLLERHPWYANQWQARLQDASV